MRVIPTVIVAVSVASCPVVSAGAGPLCVPVDRLAADRCRAQPGNVPAPLARGAAGVEIAGWATAGSPTARAGEFVLRLQRPTAVGSVLVYGPGRVAYETQGRFRPLGGARLGQGLRVLPVPVGEGVSAVRAIVEAALTGKTLTQGATYSASLGYVALLSRRMVNVAGDAFVAVSSAGPPSEGFRPRPWLNQPETLTDGFIHRDRNFASAPPAKGPAPGKNEWVLLSWPEPTRIDAVVVFRGRGEKGLGEVVVEAFAGRGDPRFARGNAGWQSVPGRWSAEGPFRAGLAFVPDKPVTTRGLRLRTARAGRQITLGEIVVLRDLGDAPAPPAKAPPAGATIAFDVPGAGKATIQVRDAAGRLVANPAAGIDVHAGRNVVEWDLTDVVGEPILSPGTYRWRGLYHPGLKVTYKHTFYPFPLAHVAWQTPSRTGGWLADHEPPRTIARAGEHMWLGAFAEAGDSIVEVDANANKLWGIDRIWVAIPAEICTDGEWYYGWCEGGWIRDNQAIIQIHTASKRSRKVFQRPMPAKGTAIAAMRSGQQKRGVTGFQVLGKKAFVSFGALDVIQVFDLTKGIDARRRGFGWDIAYKQFDELKPVLLKEISLPRPGRIRKAPGGQLVAISGGDVVAIDPKTCAVSRRFATGLVKPLGLGVAPDGAVYVGDGERHQVVGFSPAGQRVTVLGKPGRREVGPFDEDDLQDPHGVEVGPRGNVWVMEYSHWPKRVSVWDPKRARCVRSVYGPSQYGGGGCLDPADDRRLFYKGMEFRRETPASPVRPVNLYYRPDSKRYARFPDRDYPEYAFRSRGSLWFTSFMHPHEHPSLVLWQYRKDHAMPVAAIGSAVVLRQVFGHKPAHPGNRKDFNDTSFLKEHVPGYEADRKLFTWTDLNADGRVDVSELTLGKLEVDGRLVYHASAGWNWRMNERFEAAANAGRRGGVMVFRPKGFSKHGYPIYDVPTKAFPGRGEALGTDSAGNAIVLGGPVTCIQSDGAVRWRYRNDWPGLHAGHHTTARGDEPGVLIAPTRIWGIVRASEALGDVVAFNSNLGCTYLMTTDDGLYIDRVFRDQRVGLLWRMEKPPSPDVLAETSLYDEHFGGTFQKARGADGKDRFYYVVGKNHCSVVELTGLDRVRRLAGGTFAVTGEQIAAAEARRQGIAARKARPKVYDVPRAAPGLIKLDGRDNEWPKDRIDGFALAYDDEKLYVLHSGRDRSPVFDNKGANPVELFKTGDVVDVMLQTRAGLDDARGEAGPGDIRLSFAMFQGKCVCVLYDFRVPGHTGPRVGFRSPWRTVWCDRAGILRSAEIAVTRGGGRFTLEAAVPLKDVHLDPKRLRQTRGDVGRVMGDQTGTAASARVYWANKNTAILSDLPSEAALQPRLWGLLRFKNARGKPRR